MGSARERDYNSPMLKLRLIGIRDYTVLDDMQAIGRIRYASERAPGIWLWNIQVHLAITKPMGTATDLEAANELGRKPQL
jgi:hypothetical protein